MRIMFHNSGATIEKALASIITLLTPEGRSTQSKSLDNELNEWAIRFI